MLNYGAVTVTSALTQILGPQNSRRSYILANNGSQTFYFGFDTNVTDVTGIPLVSGEKLEVGGYQDVWRGVVYGICSAATTTNVRYCEWGTQ